MEYIKAIEKDLDAVWELVQETIKTVYPKYYPAEVVDFFCEHHCKDNIAKDIERTSELEKLGYKVIRFWNNELTNIEDVYLELEKYL